MCENTFLQEAKKEYIPSSVIKTITTTVLYCQNMTQWKFELC